MVTMRYVPVLRRSVASAQNITPALASCALLVASFLPWLKDPLGKVYSAWQLSLYPDWDISSMSYGLLCLVCSACILLVARADKPFRGRWYSATLCCFCLIPAMLFLLQYLCVDASSLIQLMRHELQFLLMQQHFGYQATTQLFPFSPLTLQTSTLAGRLQLLLDQVSPGPPVLSVCAGCVYRFSLRRPAGRAGSVGWYSLFCGACVCILLVMLMRAPSGMLCECAAKEALASGNYSGALSLLDAARMFAPELEQVASYHSERGQAQYFLAPAQPTLDSQVYLARVYREQGDYLEAYQQLLGVWRIAPSVSWVIDEMDVTLESLTESLRPLRGISTKRVASDDAALPWLQILIKVDPSNIYGLYMAGRIQYDLYNYTACIDYMSLVIQKCADAAVQSSAYTYSALSEAGLGHYAVERLQLFKAVSLDPNYHNNTAREELSGLH